MEIVKLHPEKLTFEDFWKVCPKKVGRALTRAKFDAITSDAGLQTRTLDRDSGNYVDIHLKATASELVSAMRRYEKAQTDPKTFGLKEDGKFTLHPATWLNQGRWMDQ